MHKWESEIKDHAVQLQCSQKGVLREDILQKFISDRHWHSLEQPAIPIRKLFMFMYINVTHAYTNTMHI